MPAFEHPIFVCCNRREAVHPRGCCDPQGSELLPGLFKGGSAPAGVEGEGASQAGRLPGSVPARTLRGHLPAGVWYGAVQAQDVAEIQQRPIPEGDVITRPRIAQECLNNSACPHRRRGDRPSP